MASLRQIRRRMKSIENIHEITKAMEMIAAFRFKKAENRFTRSRSYFLEIERLISNLSRSAVELKHPLFEVREVKKKALVVVTADKGLCGSYNTNLLRRTTDWLRENKAFETALIPVGKVGAETLRKRGAPVVFSYPEKTKADFPMARQITDKLTSLFLEKKADSVEILYMTYHGAASGKIRLMPFLSLSRLLEKSDAEAQGADYIYEPDAAGIFPALLARFLEGELFGVLLESLTSEYSARMVAMKQASDNGEEVLDSLKVLRNKTRQATITRELSEIVSGASVLV